MGGGGGVNTDLINFQSLFPSLFFRGILFNFHCRISESLNILTHYVSAVIKINIMIKQGQVCPGKYCKNKTLTNIL